jgi:hypothetical protein
MFKNNEPTTPKADDTFLMQVFAQQLELLTKVMKDLKDEITLMRQKKEGWMAWGWDLIREETLFDRPFRMLKLTLLMKMQI